MISIKYGKKLTTPNDGNRNTWRLLKNKSVLSMLLITTLIRNFTIMPVYTHDIKGIKGHIQHLYLRPCDSFFEQFYPLISGFK